MPAIFSFRGSSGLRPRPCSSADRGSVWSLDADAVSSQVADLLKPSHGLQTAYFTDILSAEMNSSEHCKNHMKIR